jgi:hypothetical protein
MVVFMRLHETPAMHVLCAQRASPIRTTGIERGECDMKWHMAMMAIAAPLALVATNVYSANPHVVGDDILCTVQGDVLTCSGTIAGVGNVETVRLEADASCVNRGQHTPRGHLSSPDEPVTEARNGRFTFNNVRLDAGCPGPMTAQFTNPVLVFTTNRGEVRVPVTITP